MGIATPEPLTRTGVFWTQFPAHALSDVDWRDHRQAHRGIMRLFPRTLDGPADQRRAKAGILYRLDLVGEVPTVLVQSSVRPELTPELSRTTEISPRAWSFQEGDTVAFRVAVNPIARSTQYFSDATKRQQIDRDGSAKPSKKAIRAEGATPHTKQIATTVKPEDLPGWLAAKIGSAIADIQVVNHYRDVTTSGPQRLVTDTIDAIATVQDAEALDRIRREGIGRAKAYGCGLLTLRRTSL